MMAAVTVTKHAKKRLKQRAHKNWQKAADNAFAFGIDHGDLKGRLKKYVDHLAFKGRAQRANVSAYKVYRDHVYIFSGDVLVTVLHVPSAFLPLCRRLTDNTANDCQVGQ